MDQAATLTTGWEPDTPLDDSIVRQFVLACANRVAWMAGATAGRGDRDPAACIADAGSAFGYDNAAVILQPGRRPPRQRRRTRPVPAARLPRPPAPHDLGAPPINRHER